MMWRSSFDKISLFPEILLKLYFVAIFISKNVVLAFPLLLMAVLRQGAIFASRYFVPGVGKAFGARDVYFLEDYTRRHVHSIVTMSTLHGDISAGGGKRLLQAAQQAKDKRGPFAKYPELAQIQTSFLGYPFWKDDPNFKIENHVHYVTIDDDSGRAASSDSGCFRDWESIVSEFSGRPYAPRMSPWEVYVVRNFPSAVEAEGSLGQTVVIMFRAHHLLMDGFSMVSMLMTLLGEDAPPPPQQPRESPLNTVKMPGLLKWWSLMMWSIPEGSRKLSSQVNQNRRIQQILFGARLKLEAPVRDHIIHYKYSSPLPLDELRGVAAHFRVRVSSVLTTLLAESISNVTTQIEERLAALYVCPLQNHPGNLANHALYSTLEVPLSTDQPISEKLHSINESYLGLSSNPVSGALLYSSFLLGNLHPLVYRYFQKRGLFSPLVITNFSLGPVEFQSDRVECIDIRAGCRFTTKVTGSLAIIVGYKNHVRVLFAGHDALFSEEQVERIASGIAENFDKLVRSAA